ncbi:MAG: hypothetical protein KAU95_00540, partial [Candidatus Aenigmarchaeota archaeon]|nr:hypothetical protein [Candidatus Aenigmarchaeota archaeon]
MDALGGQELCILNEDIKILNFQTPENLTISLGNANVWNKTGKFIGEEQLSLNVSPIDDFLNSCGEDLCLVPINYSADTSGRLRIKNPKINYTYNALGVISFESDIQKWEKTDNILVNQSMMRKAVKINYLKTPVIPLHVQNIYSGKILDWYQTGHTNLPVFNGYTCSLCGGENDLVDLGYTDENGVSHGCDKDYYLNNFGPVREVDYLWYNNTSTAAPVRLNASGIFKQGRDYLHNLTIWRTGEGSGENFTNVIANFSLNETYISGDSFIKVDINNSGTYIDITPANSETDCDSSAPTYTITEIGGLNISVCKQDTDASEIADFFKWKQSVVSGEFSDVDYRLGGDGNVVPSLSNIS